MQEKREEIIKDYIKAYNNFNIDDMLLHLHREFEFINITGGQENMRLRGIAAFGEQAAKAAKLFSQRCQQIVAISFFDNVVEVQVNYEATLAEDLQSSLKKGDSIKLQGKSIFTFEDNRIVQLTDIS